MFSNNSYLYYIKIGESVTLESAKCVKILVVQVDSRLSFSEHIAGLYKMVGRRINALSSLSKTFDLTTKLERMQTFVLSHFNFVETLWHFFL